jgi:hypothetical protein
VNAAPITPHELYANGVVVDAKEYQELMARLLRGVPDSIVSFIEQSAALELRKRTGSYAAAYDVAYQLTQGLRVAIDELGRAQPLLAAAAVSVKPLPEFQRCPITGRPYFMHVEHPERGSIPTFGGPFDSYTIPEVDEDGCLRCERYDHDAGHWIEGGESLGCYLTREQPDCEDLPAFVPQSDRGVRP